MGDFLCNYCDFFIAHISDFSSNIFIKPYGCGSYIIHNHTIPTFIVYLYNLVIGDIS